MKCYAKIGAVRREDPVVLFDVQYSLLYGATRTDCAALQVSGYTNESGLIYLLKIQLKNHLNLTYAPETFLTTDIVLFGG